MLDLGVRGRDATHNTFDCRFFTVSSDNLHVKKI